MRSFILTFRWWTVCQLRAAEVSPLAAYDVLSTVAVACLRHAAFAPRRPHPTLRSTSLRLYGVNEVSCLRHEGGAGFRIQVSSFRIRDSGFGIQDSSRLMWPYPKSQNRIFLLAYARSDSGRGLRGMLPEARGCLLTQRRHLAPCRKRYTIPARQRYKIFYSIC